MNIDLLLWAREMFGALDCVGCGFKLNEDENELHELCRREDFVRTFNPRFRGPPLCYSCAGVIANGFCYRMGGAEILTPGSLGFPKEEAKPPSTRGKITGRRRMKIFERDDYTCQGPGCGSRSYLVIDHKMPICAGGSNEDENLQTLCATCNSDKGSSLDWKGRTVLS